MMRIAQKLLAFGLLTAFTCSAQSADLNAPYVPQAAYEPQPVPCYAAFYLRPDAQGPSLARHGPEEVPVIRHLRYANGRSLNHRVRSVTTGPGATIELFNGRNYRKPMFKIGPGSMVNLRRPVVDSYRLYCEAPAAPPPAYVPMK